MAGDGTIKIELELDPSKAEKDLDKQAQKLGDKIKNGIEGGSKGAGDSLADNLKVGAEKGAQSAGDAIGKGLGSASEKAGSNAGKTIGQYITQGISKVGFDPLANGLESVAKKADSVGTSLTNKVTKPALAAATALAGITIGAGFARLTAIDTAKAKLEGLGNTAESVTAIMQDAQASVKGTSFSLGEAATSAGMAVASGVSAGKELTSYLSTVANTAAVAGTSMESMGANIGQVFATGAAYLGDLNKMVTAGIPIFEMLANEMGITTAEVKELASSGEISSEVFLRALDRNLGSAATIAARTGMAVSDVNAMLDTMAEDGVASFEELNEITEKGVDAFELLSKSLNLTTDEIKQLARDGQISSEQLKEAFDSGLGGAAKVIGEKSLQGAISNVGAAIARVGANFLDAGGQGEGFFSQIKPLLVEFMGYLEGVEGEAKNWGQAFGQGFADAVNFIRSNSDVIKEFGGDIARNFSEVVDVLKDFAKGAKEAFDALPESTQDLLVKLALLAPAATVAFGPFLKLLNPILSIAGKLVGSIGTLASNFIRLGGTAGVMSAFGTKVMDMGGKAGIAKTALSGLKAGAIGLGVVLAGVAVAALLDYRQKLINMEKATTDTSKAMDSFNRGFSGAAIKTDGIDRAKKSVMELRDEVDNAASSIVNMSETNAKTWQDIGAESGLLTAYVDEIKELTSQSELNEEAQGRLLAAVAGYNQITGENISVIDAQAGIISVSTSQLEANSEAWIANAKAQAAQEQIIEWEKERIGLLETRSSAENELKEAIAEKERMEADGTATSQLGTQAYIDQTKKVSDLEGSLKDLDGQISTVEGKQQDLVNVTAKSARQMAMSAESIRAYVDGLEGMAQKFADTGKSSEDFSNTLSDLKITQEELGRLTPGQLSSWVDAYDGTTGSIEGIVSEWRQAIANETGAAAEEAGNNATAAAVNVSSGLDSGIPTVNDRAKALNTSIRAPLEGLPEFGTTTGIGLSGNFASGISSDGGAANSNAVGVANSARSGLLSVSAYDAGIDFTSGYARGISSGFSGAVNAAAFVAASALAAVKSAQASASPSKKSMALGNNFGEGYAIGISMMENMVSSKSENLATTAMSSLANGFTGTIPVLENSLDKISDVVESSFDAISIQDIDAIPDASLYGLDAFRAAITATTQQVTNNYTLIFDGTVINEDARMQEIVLTTINYAVSKGGQ